ncbi:hypothetical protein Hanom_Chr14g01273461 [Helianthus anomalus]
MGMKKNLNFLNKKVLLVRRELIPERKGVFLTIVFESFKQGLWRRWWRRR